MYVVMGATGHVGSAVARTLLRRGEAVTIITRDAAHADQWAAKGAKIAEADVNETASLRAALRRGRRAFLLNPPASPTTDTDVTERQTVASILEALEGSDLEKVVAASTAGAQPGRRLGDLNTLWELEEGLRKQSIPAAINRGAYYYSNWDQSLKPVRETGKLASMFPADFKLPMVAPEDLGEAAAHRLVSSLEDVGVRNIEGPRRYAPSDVARAFAEALGRPVQIDVTPRDQWAAAYRKLGFSDAAAESYARMTGATLDAGSDFGDDPIRGATTLEAYVRELAARA